VKENCVDFRISVYHLKFLLYVFITLCCLIVQRRSSGTRGSAATNALGNAGVDFDMHASSDAGFAATAADARKRRRGGPEPSHEGADFSAIGAGKSPRRNASLNKSTIGISASTAGDSSTSESTSSGPPFSLAHAAGVERLMPLERSLCEHLHLLPHQYQQIKSTIVSLALARGQVRCDDAAESLVYVGKLIWLYS
jgi:hypothetical protein